MRRLILILFAVIMLTAACDAETHFEALSNEEQIELLQNKGLSEWQIKTLGNLGLGLAEMFELTDEQIKEIFAPGTNLDGIAPNYNEERSAELVKRGYDEEEILILLNLGFSYDEILNLTNEQMEFIFPNTELLERLVAIGYERERIDNIGALWEAGWDSYRDLLMEAWRQPITRP